jgi:hypothetical protein
MKREDLVTLKEQLEKAISQGKDTVMLLLL